MKGEDLGQLTHPDLPGSFLVLALGTPSVPAKPKPLVTLVRQLVGSNWVQSLGKLKRTDAEVPLPEVLVSFVWHTSCAQGF